MFFNCFLYFCSETEYTLPRLSNNISLLTIDPSNLPNFDVKEIYLKRYSYKVFLNLIILTKLSTGNKTKKSNFILFYLCITPAGQN